MIDKLVLHCDFKKVVSPFTDSGYSWPSFQLAELGIPLEMSINADGQVFRTRHPYESIPSHYENMAFKIFDNRWDGLDKFYVEIKASPAKIMQGHNVYGSADFYDCALHLIELLRTTYPRLFSLLNQDSWFLEEIDITYSSRAQSNNEARAFINSLHCVSFGQTKARTGYDGTAYFGKKSSRLKKIKVYSKSPEVLETIKRNDRRPDGEIYNEVFTPELLKFSEGLIRWESTLYNRYLERAGISCKLTDIFRFNTFTPEHQIELWIKSTKDLFKALEGQEMKTLNNQEIKDKLRAKFSKTSQKTGKVSTVLADSAYRTYNDLCRDGWEVTSESMSRANFHRHITMLTECGLSRAALQNMNGLNDGAQIIPFVRFIQVDFGAQFPENYQQPAPKYVHPPRLSLVA